MRKTIMTLVALCATVAAHATILRVSNVNGSTAPYKTIQAAIAAAVEGDTIMVDASPTEYSWGRYDKVDKRVVILGPGYWRKNNGIVQEDASNAYIGGYGFVIAAEGVVIIGLWLDSQVVISNNIKNVVVKRCNLRDGASIGSGADRCVFHQNFIRNDVRNGGAYHQITNNIFIKHFDNGYTFKSMPHCYVAYNTFLGKNGIRFWDCGNCTIEKNIGGSDFYTEGSANSFNDNIVTDAVRPYNTSGNNIIDKELKELNLSSTHGAFAGDSPYVISGLPSAPVIEDLEVPTTVEYGSTMNVTLKIGVQK